MAIWKLQKKEQGNLNNFYLFKIWNASEKFLHKRRKTSCYPGFVDFLGDINVYLGVVITKKL